MNFRRCFVMLVGFASIVWLSSFSASAVAGSHCHEEVSTEEVSTLELRSQSTASAQALMQAQLSDSRGNSHHEGEDCSEDCFVACTHPCCSGLLAFFSDAGVEIPELSSSVKSVHSSLFRGEFYLRIFRPPKLLA